MDFLGFSLFGFNTCQCFSCGIFIIGSVNGIDCFNYPLCCYCMLQYSLNVVMIFFTVISILQRILIESSFNFMVYYIMNLFSLICLVISLAGQPFLPSTPRSTSLFSSSKISMQIPFSLIILFVYFLTLFQVFIVLVCAHFRFWTSKSMSNVTSDGALYSCNREKDEENHFKYCYSCLMECFLFVMQLSLLHSQSKSIVGTPTYIASKVLSRQEYDGKVMYQLNIELVLQSSLHYFLYDSLMFIGTYSS